MKFTVDLTIEITDGPKKYDQEVLKQVIGEEIEGLDIWVDETEFEITDAIVVH